VPFEADTYMGVLTQHMFVQPLRPSQVSAAATELGALEDITMVCLAKKPEERYGSMEELSAALDEVVQFQTGLAFMTGPPGRPLRAGASVIDMMGAVFGVVAAQAAPRERDITGKGQRVSSALFETAAFLMSTHMAGMTATGLEARPMPARRGAWAIYEVFQTANDGQLFIGVTSDQQWSRFVEEFSLQALAADPRLDTNFMRLQERSWLIPALQEILVKFPQDEVAARCERANVSWAPVGQPGDLFTDPHLLATGGLVDVFISRMGQHNAEVLAEAGFSPPEVAALAESGVIVAATDADGGD